MKWGAHIAGLYETDSECDEVISPYCLRRFDGATIVDTARTLPRTISGGVVTANPCSQDPAGRLSAPVPRFLDRPR